MINHLYIKDFILIDELSLDFEPGFSVFIGETGAGKSILIDAISLLYRERANASYISKGKDKAIIEGTFDLSHNERAISILNEAGFETDGIVTFTRELSSSGKNTARIDRRIVTISLMKECLECEIDIHSQRDSQYLLNSSLHIDLLDEYLNNSALLQKTEDLYKNYKELLTEKENALSGQFNESDMEFIRFQLAEIDSAKIQPEEDQALEEKEKKYKAVRSSYERINSICEQYDSLSDNLYELQHEVQSLENTDSFSAIQSAVKDGYFQIDAAIEELRHSLDEYGFDEDDINAMEERLFLLQRLKRKYGGSLEEVLSKKAAFEKQINLFEHRQEYLNEIDQRIDTAYHTYMESAQKLSDIRRKGSIKLDKEIAMHLKDLSLPNAVFITKITDSEPGRKGIDSIEFYVSMNKGEDPKPLSKIASGGEISRLMLGLKTIFTSLQKLGTVIFDEIDTGVSGAVATAIGRKMRQLSSSTQVFAVTHLAPVAASAKYHYLVEKTQSDDHTVTSVHLLNKQDTIHEIALITSGEATEASRKVAEELLHRNGTY